MNRQEFFPSSTCHRLVAANGLLFDVAELGKGDKLALCLHGFPECNVSWRHQMSLLADRGYRVWAPNSRGYGDSSKPSRIRDYAISKLTADVAGLIDAANCKSTLLLGHDWGAVIAWAVAIRAVRPLHGLVIMNVPHPALFYASMRTLEQLRRSWYMFFFQIPWLPERMLGAENAKAIGRMMRGTAQDKSRFDNALLDVYRANAGRPGALRAMLNYYRALRYQSEWSGLRNRVRTIDTPTLMIWGEADTALGKATTIGTQRYVSDLSLHYLPGVSHWVQQEAPERVNEILSQWLGEKFGDP